MDRDKTKQASATRAKPRALTGKKRLERQPVWKRNGELVAWGPRALESRPGLVLLMKQVLAAWVELESLVAEAYAVLLFGEERTALELFLAFDRAEQRARMFLTTAQLRLSEADFEACRKLVGDYRDGAGDRVIVAHGLWAVAEADELSDSILLIDVSERTRRVFEICGSGGDLNADDMTPDSYAVFQREDFEDMINVINDLRERWFAFIQRLIARGRLAGRDKASRGSRTEIFGAHLAPDRLDARAREDPR